MKKTALTLITLSFVVAGSAVVGGPNPDNGMGITSKDGSSSASKAVGPNGTEYTSYFSVDNVTQSNNTGIKDFSWDGKTVSFEGVYVKDTPETCYKLEHDVEGSDGDYSFDVSAERIGNRSCTRFVTEYSYNANFTSDEPFKLNVTHDGESVESFKHPEYGEEEKKSSGLFSVIVSIIVGIFS